MSECGGGCHAPARGALQEALLDEIGFDNVFNRVGGFADGGGNVFQADRAAAEFVQHGFQEFPVHHVQTDFVHV